MLLSNNIDRVIPFVEIRMDVKKTSLASLAALLLINDKEITEFLFIWIPKYFE